MTTHLPSPNGLSQQIYDTLGDYLRRDPAALHPEDSLRDDLGLDSLQTIELVYQVESVFDLQIPDEDFGRLRTIGDVLTAASETIEIIVYHQLIILAEQWLGVKTGLIFSGTLVALLFA